MAGYTRQSVASIINGANITAPPLNAEFNQLLAAFSGSTGHTHTGGTGDAPPIPLATSVSGYLLPANGGVGGKNSNAQSTNPVVGDDNADGYAPGSIWLNGTNNRLFVNLNNSTGAAVWGEYLLNNASNQVLPHTDDTVDLGSSTKQFKDLYIDGTAYVDTLNADAATIGGTLGVTGAITFSSTAAITGNTTVGGTLGVTGATTLSDNLSVSGNTTVSGNTSLNGNTTVGNAASDTVTFTGQVASDFIPSTDGTHDLGSSTKEWQDLYIDGTANIDSLVADTADIDGGSIDGAVIGGSVQSSGQFSSVTSTNLTASGAISFASATISNLGTVTTANIDGGTIDGVTLGVNSPITNAQVDNININGSAITSTNTNGNIAITPNGSGEVDISKVDIDSGTIDNTAIGSSTASSGAFTTVTTSGQATLASADINGGTVDGAVIGGSSPQAITGTTITANSGFVGGVTGNVTGNLTGNVTGNVTGDLTGDVTGNITASSGTSTVNNLVVNGTANFTNTPLTNISDPSSAQDAATKNYVDTQVAGLVDSAPGTLDTLNELAAALGDDPDFATTITNSIATKLPLAGGTMSGAIAMGTSKITGVGDPTANQDAATKNYTDTQDALKLNLSGGTMSGAIAMGTNKITGAGDPTNAQDVATKNYIDTLFGSTTSAASSASAAATSATNAATSATNAASSATAAATSATNAANSYDDFDDRYLGAKSSAPTTDNDGDALVIGALYFDTTANSMKVYSSGGWVAAGSSVNGTSQRYDYVVGTNSGSYTDGSTTTFPATYDSGFVDVYLNGVKLVVGTDVTATSGTNVVLASPAATGDNICIVGYGTFQLANFSVGEANDVDLTGNANNAILAYDSTDSRFEPTLTPTLTSLTTTGGLVASGLSQFSDVNIPDNNAVRFGNSQDLQIYHDGSNSYIDDAGTGGLSIRSNLLQIGKYTGELSAQFVADGESNLYYDNSKKIATTSTGIDVTGTVNASTSLQTALIEYTDGDDALVINDGGGVTVSNYLSFPDNKKAFFGTGDDLQIYHDGSNSYIQDTGTGDLILRGDNVRIKMGSSNDDAIRTYADGAVELYHNDAKKLETSSTGITVTGQPTFNVSDQSIKVVNSGNAAHGLEIYRGSDGSKGASFGWGNGSANLEIKNFRNDGQATGPYANIDFHTGGTDADSPDYNPTRRMRIQQTGEVGINVDDPTNKLHIKSDGTGRITGLRLENGNTAVGDGPKINFTSGTSTEGAGIAGHGTALNKADLILYADGNTEQMRLAGEGRIHQTAHSIGNVASNSQDYGGAEYTAGIERYTFSIQGDGTWRTIFPDFRDTTGFFYVTIGDAASRDTATYQYNITSVPYGISTLTELNYSNNGWNTGDFEFRITANNPSYNLQCKFTSYYSTSNVASGFIMFNRLY